MERDERIKIAITAGIAGAVLLILVLYLAISGSSTKKTPENTEIAENTAAVELSTENSEEVSVSAEGTSLEAATEMASESASEASTAQEVLAGKNESTTVANKKIISGNSFYPTESAKMKNVYKKIAYEVEPQLKEMFGYWNDGNLDAVTDLAHLERFEIMSYSLDGTKDFYYYGEKNADGVPEGKGIALYANDQYYFGEWKNGLRNGQGMWISFYPEYDSNVVLKHQYTGEWMDDLPNGSGQEHYDYVQSRMNSSDLYLQNAIGEFKNGFYNGRMYIITVNNEYKTKEWYGDCEFGNWKQVLYTAPDKKGRIAVLDEKDNADNHIWMTEDAAKNNGISGIISGGKMVSK